MTPKLDPKALEGVMMDADFVVNAINKMSIDLMTYDKVIEFIEARDQAIAAPLLARISELEAENRTLRNMGITCQERAEILQEALKEQIKVLQQP